MFERIIEDGNVGYTLAVLKIQDKILFNHINLYLDSTMLKMAFTGTDRWVFASGSISSTASYGPELRNLAGGATTPTFRFSGDSDTGVSRAAADALALIAGGVEGVRISETAGAISITGGGINVENGLSQRVAVPATAGATGTTGQFAFDANFFYACVGTDTWVRVGLTTW